MEIMPNNKEQPPEEEGPLSNFEQGRYTGSDGHPWVEFTNPETGYTVAAPEDHLFDMQEILRENEADD